MEIKLIQERIPEYVNRTADILIDNGYEAYLVGGAIRDIILGRDPKDYDLATNALPEQIAEIFPKTINTNAKFGTILVIMTDDKGENFDVEVTTYRKEEDYVKGRWPSKVEFTSDIEEDLSRRDFTINAMALDMQDLYDQGATISEVVFDPFTGLEDIDKKQIKAVGIAKERFEEDGLRAYKACRLASELEFEIEHETFEAIKGSIAIAKQISIERVRDELLKLLKYSPKPSIGVNLLKDTGLLQLFMPELLDCVGVEQPEWHTEDVYTHSLKTLDLAEDSVKLAALLHDIGKPATISKDEKGTHFYGHDVKGAEIAMNILKRLRFSNNVINRNTTLIKYHMFYYPSADWRKEKDVTEISQDEDNGGWTDAAIRRFIKNIGGDDIIDDLFKLRIADATANPKSEFNPVEIEALEKRIAKVRAEDMALKVTDLDINGNDLIELGLEGKRIGEVLNQLLEMVIDDPSLNDNDKLREIVSKLINK
ncbi:HD domain-containing protein [Candidatus Dojkabacteria bacterium]|uniref:HD domain-containing protein n=1 Tax=Candidatus Dojkabacteria bacterium TaxID=2099670 RepID=A0A955L622_9BACT|nr:HD domain-containing protein [Candidatus Dojkabacteria bacterium]